MKNNKGFTLVELLVVMAIFIGVIIMTSSAFDSILRGTSQHMKSAESQIEGIVGLEMLRYDIEHAGFGLPWTFQNNSTVYTEVDTSTGVAGVVNAGLVDNPPNNPPRALVGQVVTSGTSYLVVKSMVAALNKDVKRWGYVNYSASLGANVSYIKKWVGDPYNFTVEQGDQVIALNTSFPISSDLPDKKLVMSSGAFYTTVVADPANANNLTFQNSAFKPPDSTQMYAVYTVKHPSVAGAALAMPYNRADYFIKRPTGTGQVPASCNAGTGIFYKATAINGAGGGNTTYPLIDCVGDMQVILHLDMNDDGIPGTYALVDGSSVVSTEGADTASVTSTLGDPSLIRSRLKQVQVYLLTHEGKIDPGFSYMRDTIMVGDQGLGRIWSDNGSATMGSMRTGSMSAVFGSHWRNYRWKVYSVMVRPKNLN